MPEKYVVFLSPSTQPFNKYLSGGDEQEAMNRLASLMEPLLTKNGITYGRNRLDTNVARSVELSNSGYYDLHVALHSNSASEELSGKLRGVDIYYYEFSHYGKAAAEIIAEELKKVYPVPDDVRAVPTTRLYELRRTNAPAVLCELGYHDNPQDEAWIRDDMEDIAVALVRAICIYFGIPFDD